MAEYIAELKEDLVDQFRDKPNIKAIMEVVGIELQAVFDFYQQLQTERDVETSVGQQLDGVGEIAVMSRREAGELSGNPIPFDVISDDLYRQYLIYKILKNNCDCTYPNIIKAFRMFWDRPLYYTEDPEQPATMIFDTGEMDGTVDTRPLFTTPLLRAAGVTTRLYARTKTELNRARLHILAGLGCAVTITELPSLERNIDFGALLYTGGGFDRFTQDTLPNLERNIDFGASVYAGGGFDRFTQDTLPSLERNISYAAKVRQGGVIGSIMETPIGGIEPPKS